MRFTSSLAALTALLASHAHIAAATAAFVLTFEPETAHTKHKIALTGLSPSTARVVLAQRAGVEDFHTTHGLSEEEITAINTYGLRTKMFDGPSQRRQAFLLAELDPETEANPMVRLQSRFSIDNPPSFEATELLFEDLHGQAYPGEQHADLRADASLNTKDSPVFHVSRDAASLVELARKLAAEKMTVTALLVSKGDKRSSWGTYELPNAGSLLKRQVPHRVDPEEPLAATSFANSVPMSPSLQVLANSSNSSSNYTNTSPLKGILPACYNSKKACESNTRGCTDHGECKLLYTNKDLKKDGSKEGLGACWGCKCNSTMSNGLTTYWAGPACQKKDISMEFWLLAGFTIGLLALVSFAVGTIWSMGEEELPSVIGAGVSGPTAKK